MGESGAAADEGPDDGDGYAVKMLQRLLDVARPKQATSRSLADTLELVVEEWCVHAAKLQGGTYNIVGGKERANAKRHLRNEPETKGVMSMVLDATGKDELPQASRCRYCPRVCQRPGILYARHLEFLKTHTSADPRILQVED